MKQSELNRRVATITGETVNEIARRGFVPLTSQPCEREPLTIDWDELDAERNVTVVSQRTRTPGVV